MQDYRRLRGQGIQEAKLSIIMIIMGIIHADTEIGRND